MKTLENMMEVRELLVFNRTLISQDPRIQIYDITLELYSYGLKQKKEVQTNNCETALFVLTQQMQDSSACHYQMRPDSKLDELIKLESTTFVIEKFCDKGNTYFAGMMGYIEHKSNTFYPFLDAVFSAPTIETVVSEANMYYSEIELKQKTYKKVR